MISSRIPSTRTSSYPGEGERTRSAADGATLLTLFLWLLLAFPSKLVIGPLGAAGAPAGLLAAAAAGWWVLAWMAGFGPSRIRRMDPVRIAMIAFAFAIGVSYVMAMSRPIGSSELNSADAGLILLVGWAGLVVVTGDGISNRDRLETLVSRLVIGVGLVALLGVVQFGTGHSFVDQISLPGFRNNNGPIGLQDRDGFARVTGTAIHPIEFGVVVSAMIPLCVRHLLYGRTSRLWRWGPLLCTAVAVPLAISRSALIGVVVALVFAVPYWTPAVRRIGAFLGLAVIGSIFVLVPGMLGTLMKLFTRASEDSSTLSRTGSYELAGQFIERSPLFGRGFLTFLPEYRTLDNQYLGLLIDVGVVGTLAFVGLLTTGVVCARRLGRDADARTRSLASSLAASIAAAGITFAFFDALSFPMISSLTFLLLGILGCLVRLQRLPT